MDITVSTSKLKETKEFYTKYLKFKVMKETSGFLSLLPGPGDLLCFAHVFVENKRSDKQSLKRVFHDSFFFSDQLL